MTNANRELDVEVAKALGWTNITVHPAGSPEGTCYEWIGGRMPHDDYPASWNATELPLFSTDLNAAYSIVPKDGFEFVVIRMPDGSTDVDITETNPRKIHRANVGGYEGEHIAEAICRAFLAWKAAEK